jgi:hypothetical protein
MRFTNLLTPFLAAMATFASPVPAPAPLPAEIDPNKGPVVRPGEATWYCAYSWEIVYEHWELVGYKWGINEADLRKVIPGHVKSWYYENLDNVANGWGSFRASVSFFSPLF